jgi:hypothetical protein
MCILEALRSHVATAAAFAATDSEDDLCVSRKIGVP